MAIDTVVKGSAAALVVVLLQGCGRQGAVEPTTMPMPAPAADRFAPVVAEAERLLPPAVVDASMAGRCNIEDVTADPGSAHAYLVSGWRHPPGADGASMRSWLRATPLEGGATVDRFLEDRLERPDVAAYLRDPAALDAGFRHASLALPDDRGYELSILFDTPRGWLRCAHTARVGGA